MAYSVKWSEKPENGTSRSGPVDDVETWATVSNAMVTNCCSGTIPTIKTPTLSLKKFREKNGLPAEVLIFSANSE